MARHRSTGVTEGWRRSPIFILVDAVEAAVRTYDKAGAGGVDHLAHPGSDDCIRCRLLKAILVNPRIDPRTGWVVLP